MIFHVLTLFPEMVKQATSFSILGRAIKSGIVQVNPINIRDFAINKHGQVDDAPYGGGAGMVLMPTPIYSAYESICSTSNKKAAMPLCGGLGATPPLDDGNCDSNFLVKRTPPVIFLSPQGKTLNQAKVKELSTLDEMVLLCGHYEGLDERIIEEIVTEEISIGDYILTGGELAALVLMDSVSRLKPGVLGKSASFEDESFSDGLLEYPHYTRPPEFRGRVVPDVLLSGHHANINEWRRNQSIIRTKEKRPDLLS